MVSGIEKNKMLILKSIKENTTEEMLNIKLKVTKTLQNKLLKSHTKILH